MRKKLFLSISIILALSLFVAGPSSYTNASRLYATSPSLGGAESFSVLAGAIVTNTGPTTVQGNLGISPSIGVPPHASGFPPGIVGPPGVIHDADAEAAAAQAGNTAAFTALDQGCDVTYAGVQDLTLVSPLIPGTYCADAFILTGNLTLEGAGVWIFKSASTLITSSGSSVTGGDPCNVWWRVVSSATLATNSTMIGNVLALTDIALQTGATLNGRVLAQTGQVTLDNNTISGPFCVQLPTPTSTTEAPTPTSTTEAPTPTGTYAPPTATAEVPTATNLPVMTALPPTGGAPLQSDSSPWGLLIVGSALAMVLLLGSVAHKKPSKPRQ
jgi:hypothetical protein